MEGLSCPIYIETITHNWGFRILGSHRQTFEGLTVPLQIKPAGRAFYTFLNGFQRRERVSGRVSDTPVCRLRRRATASPKAKGIHSFSPCFGLFGPKRVGSLRPPPHRHRVRSGSAGKCEAHSSVMRLVLV